MIDWEGIADLNGYSSVREMLVDWHYREMIPIVKIADELLVSFRSVQHKMELLDLPRRDWQTTLADAGDVRFCEKCNLVYSVEKCPMCGRRGKIVGRRRQR